METNSSQYNNIAEDVILGRNVLFKVLDQAIRDSACICHKHNSLANKEKAMLFILDNWPCAVWGMYATEIAIESGVTARVWKMFQDNIRIKLQNLSIERKNIHGSKRSRRRN